MGQDFLISLKLADRSHYPLFRSTREGYKRLELKAAHPSQEKVILEFFWDDERKSNHLLGAMEIERPDNDIWQDLVLTISMEPESLEVRLEESQNERIQRFPLPEQEAEESRLESPQAKTKSNSVLVGIFSGLLFLLNLLGAFALGDYLSSTPPPPLVPDHQITLSEQPIR